MGIQLYTVGADLTKDPPGTLKKIAQIGYTEVEIAGLGKLTATEFSNLLRDAGLRAPSAHLNFGMQDTAKLLDDAKTLGAHYAVSSVLMAKTPEKGMQDFLKILNAMTADDFRQTAARANEIGKQAKAAGLQYAYHNHNFEFRDLGNGLTGYEILLKETDPALVQFEADCGWMKVAGKDPIDLLSKHAGEVCDAAYQKLQEHHQAGDHADGARRACSHPIGQGSINLKPIVEAGLKAGIKHMFVEQEPPFKEMPAMEAAEADYKVLHSLLERA